MNKLSTVWLWKELGEALGSIHWRDKVRYKILAGISECRGTYPNLVVKSSSSRQKISAIEAHTIAYLAFTRWDGDAIDLPGKVADWLSDNARQTIAAQRIIRTINLLSKVTYGDLARLAIAANYRASERTIRRWVQEAGGEFRSREVCPPKVFIAIVCQLGATVDELLTIG